MLQLVLVTPFSCGYVFLLSRAAMKKKTDFPTSKLVSPRCLFQAWKIIPSGYFREVCSHLRISGFLYRSLTFQKPRWGTLTFCFATCFPLKNSIGLCTYCPCGNSERKILRGKKGPILPSLVLTQCET